MYQSLLDFVTDLNENGMKTSFSWVKTIKYPSKSLEPFSLQAKTA